MLTTRMSGKPLVVKNRHVLSGALVGVSLFILLIKHLPDLSGEAGTLSAEALPVIAVRIFSFYTIPFELAGLLLLMALIGAAVITSHLKSKV
jgi:NADH-quinone oxidoreductase subunit J